MPIQIRVRAVSSDNGIIYVKNINNKHNSENREAPRIWIISQGQTINIDPSSICEEPVSGPVTEYRISELGRYMLDPNPITLEEKVMGCKVKYQRKPSGRVGNFLKKLVSGKNSSSDDDGTEVEEIITMSKTGYPDFNDEALNAHMKKINAMLRPYDPVKKQLMALDKEQIADISAVCEEVGGSRYPLNLQGSIDDKISFISNSLSQKAKVVFNKAYLLNGLFELRGFRFDLFNSDNYYRLIKVTQRNKPRYYVVDANFNFKFWLDDNSLVHYMQILEQTIATDPKLREALLLCIKNNAKPLKLFFSKKLDQQYSGLYLPLTYREVFGSLDVTEDEKETVTKALNDFQNIVFFNYIPWVDRGEQKLFTNISVMHDLRALEPIKSQLPHVYSEIHKKVVESDAGRLYLLDSIREHQSV